VDQAFFRQQCFEIAEPRVAQDAAPAPRFLLVRPPGVEIRDVQELEAVLPDRHSRFPYSLATGL